MIYAASAPIAIAADLTAGERERGSLELLLCLPVDRGIITAGKFIAGALFGFLGVLSFAGGILISLALAPGLFEIDRLRLFAHPARWQPCCWWRCF